MNHFDPSSYTELRMARTDIPGLLVIALAVFGDERGWTKENYNREKMTQIGLPAGFDPLQQNFSYINSRGVTRGFHADPWDKYITLAAGSSFVAIADFRKGATRNKVLTFDLNPGIGLFVPKGCGVGYQALEDGTIYTQLVNDFWTPDAKSVAVNLGDADLAVQWPVPLDMAQISPKDRSNPAFKDTAPVEF